MSLLSSPPASLLFTACYSVACAAEDPGTVGMASASGTPSALAPTVVAPGPSTLEPAASVPAAPEPTTQVPTALVPTTTQPTAPEPTAPMPTTSVSTMPTTPAPTTTQPTAAVPTTPEPAAPEPTGTEPADPAPTVPEPALPSYGEIYYLINQTCANIVCHVPGYYMPDLSDANNDQYEILMNTHIEQCGGAPLVDPGNPEGSAIMMVTHHQCGELAMPKDCTDPVCIPQQSVDALSAWIAAGASRD